MHYSDLAPLLRADLFLYSLPGSLNLPQTVKENYVHTPAKKPNRRRFSSPLRNGTSRRYFFWHLKEPKATPRYQQKSLLSSSGNEEAFPNILKLIDRRITLIWLLC
ncbi:hypothetical protein CEXT_90181 [Caerostris extrusa]|uniref:Uncharacterized protein n=1 Tax=Caerostris extrusa TaxID=172846 RepID=A0AAV4TYY0_CAEEX|nr:hypothetical protein CEXT_90181 [Caerostris extrusa]